MMDSNFKMLMTNKLLIALIFSYMESLYSLTTPDKLNTATTSYGILIGKQMMSRSGRNFSAFLGIPYAMPPVGKLRFLPPASPEAWEGKKNATEEGNICLQMNFLGSEDCLYLNVFTHGTRQDQLYTVMFYMHGGGFYLGSSSISELGPEYLMDRDIVLITLQYRIGVFGFLSMEDEVIPGNMGLKDQLKALQWVQQNIQAFGGDPGKVTIFGNSVGGSSVHLHMHSPLSKDLFVRGISQSGTVFSGFALAPKGVCRNITEHIALSLNCLNNNSTDMLICLQNKSSMDIFDAYKEQQHLRYDYNKILLRPVVEKNTEHAFLTTNPRKGKTEKPWLVGVNANEGVFKLAIKTLNETLNVIQTKFHDFGKQIMFFENNCRNLEEGLNSTKDFYFKNTSTNREMIKSLEQLLTDSWFVWPTQQALQHHNGPLYYYLYGHQAAISFADYWHAAKGFGVSHLDELIALFRQNFFPKLNELDTNISKIMVNMWVNFASEGNPTPYSVNTDFQKNKTTDFIWETTNQTEKMYLHIETNQLSMKKNIYSSRMDFWRQLTERLTCEV